MKLQARQYFLWAYRQLDSLKMIGENSKKCIDECMRINFYWAMNTISFPKKCCVTGNPKRHEGRGKGRAAVPMEDIVYELQDRRFPIMKKRSG